MALSPTYFAVTGMVPAVGNPLSVAVALPAASSVPVPARRVPAQNSTMPVATVSPALKTVAVAVVV